MNNIYIEATTNTPRLQFEFDKGTFEIKGNSFPEYAQDFFKENLKLFGEYAKNPLPKTIFNFKLIYINTGTNPPIEKIFNLLDDIAEKGNEVEINWFYEEEDDDMEELGRYFQNYTDIMIQRIPCGEITL